MGKLTKRERKFQASGGVQSRLKKGTITKKGKLRKRRKTGGGSHHDEEGHQQASSKIDDKSGGGRHRSDNFLGQENLGGLDMDSFFSKLTDQMDEDNDDDSEDNQHLSDDDDDDSGNEEEVSKPNKAGRKQSKASKKKEQDSSSSSSDSDSSSDSSDDDSGVESDDDIERAEAEMKAAMENIETEDPDFHKFLQENEETLLEFGAHKKKGGDDRGEEEEGDDDDEDATDVEQNEQGDKDSSQRRSSTEGIHLTPIVLRSLTQGTFRSHGIKSLKKLVAAYRSASHLADDDSADNETKTKPGESGKVYVIDSSKVFDELMVLCLKRCHEEFRYHLLGGKTASKTSEDDDEEEDEEEDAEKETTDENKPINPKAIEKSDKWQYMKPILLSFFRSTLHVMSEAKEPELQTFILKALSNFIPYLSSFPRVAESMLKSLVSLWSAPLDTTEDYQVVRLNAFLRIRQLALTQPFPFVEDCLKKTYLAYAKRAKFGAASSYATALPTITFMGNCIVELYSLDYHSSYQHAFIYIRQLALLLRSAMQKKTPESVQQVYCWQYIHSLKLWVAVLASAAPTDDGALMRSLVYPLTEIILGTARLSPSIRNLPIRFHCIRLLQQLAAAAEVFIPSTMLLLDCLDLKEWSLRPKKSSSGSNNARGMQMHYLIRLPNTDTLRTHEQLEAGISEFFVLMQREIELYRYSAGFPEYSSRIVQRLRKFSKETQNARWRTFSRGCIDTCERYSSAAVEARSKLQEAPKDVQRLECLRSASEPSMRERHESSCQKEMKNLETRMAAAAAAAAPKDAAKSKTSKADKDSADDDKGNKKKKRKTDSDTKNTKPKPNTKKLEDPRVMDLEDEVQEGVDWSSSDES